MLGSYVHQTSEKSVLLSSLALSTLGQLALAGPDSSAVAAAEVAVAAVAEAILRAGRGWGTETGAVGRRQSCEGEGSVTAAQGGGICPQLSVLRAVWCGFLPGRGWTS